MVELSVSYILDRNEIKLIIVYYNLKCEQSQLNVHIPVYAPVIYK